MLDDGLKERCQIKSAITLRALLDLLSTLFDGHSQHLFRIAYCDTLTGNTVKDGEIQLIVICVQIHEEFIYFIYYLIDSGVLLIQLVDKKDRI